MAAPRKPSDRNRRIFENSTAYRDAIAGHPRLAAEIESRHLEGAPSVVVQTYRALIRAVGFYKYNSPSALLLRGQTRCFGAMKSSIHRRTDPPTDREIETFLDAYRTLLRVDPSARGKLSTEPLLQHYGIATRWLDLVDSVPHALFFATHQMVKSPLKACHRGSGSASGRRVARDADFVAGELRRA